MKNVDDGSTVTDFLKTERERGITIQSACIPVSWKDHRINIIDTPGHVDFTIEVERALRVLDGAVTILDGVAGVEAQTETVWNQCNNYKIPRIAFVNKMDRQGANFQNAFKSLEKLKGWGKPVKTQLPVYRFRDKLSTDDRLGGDFEGVIDLLDMKLLDWKKDKSGSIVTRSKVEKELLEACMTERANLIESLAEVDEGMVECFIEADDDISKITGADIQKAVNRCTIAGTIVPVFCGAAYKNIGVQPVLDAIVDYLPSPNQVQHAIAKTPTGQIPIKISDKDLCALAFKVVYDDKRGPLVYVRVYSGILESRSHIQISNANGEKERAMKLLEMYADDFEEIPSIEAGNIGVVVGLKKVKTGDTLTGIKDNRKLELLSINVPPPVFVRSCHVESGSEEKALATALEHLLREDPSLSLTVNEETGQTLLSGMGELHLEIAGERLMEVYRVKCKLGKVEISYRETIQDSHLELMRFNKEFFGKELKCEIEMEFSKPAMNEIEIDTRIKGKDIYQAAQPELKLELVGGYPPLGDIERAIKEGIQNGLSRGPILGFPVSQIAVKVTKLGLYSPQISNISAIRAAAHSCVQHALKSTSTNLLEPVMKMKIRVPQQNVGVVSRDLTGNKRAIISNIENVEDVVVIDCTCPLAQLVGYASSLRSMTQGNGNFVMELEGYNAVSKDQEQAIVKSVRGY
ncbi:G elongation factor, mitochondrial 2 [Boothiomyces macroporosus]|uniref:Elongation factor 2 n=1 Tax=Boothiomyces macroporosus TaxID=261099 RepID=A0AAD5Y0R3_9FUNG|nr:G elongation factor, mitochondrial 2 [Boothiomyces macroporosus]